MGENKGEKGTIVVTTGGTGGHMFPAASFSREIVKEGYRIAVITDARGIKFKDEFPSSHPLYVVSASSPRGGMLKLIKGIFSLTWGFFQAFKILHEIKPRAVVSFGGYASTPAVFAAFIRRVPVIIHEQNSILGKANRSFVRFAKVLALSFENSAYVPKRKKIVYVGMPVRDEILKLAGAEYPELDGTTEFNILVLGGSLGSKVMSNVVPEGVSQLSEPLRKRIKVVQQCRIEDIDRVKALYFDGKINAEVSSFYKDIDRRMAAAHLIVTRSGASTVAEMTVIGRPSVMVPLRIAKDGDQMANAMLVKTAGAGWILEEPSFTVDSFKEIIEYLAANPVFLKEAAYNALGLGVIDASRRLVDVVLENCKK